MDEPDEPLLAQFGLDGAWRNANPSARMNALQLAEEEIDRLFSFRGHKAVAKQKRKWPREGAIDDEGRLITGIPDAVVQARAYLAACLVAGLRPLRPDVLANLLTFLRPVLDPDKPFSKHILD